MNLPWTTKIAKVLFRVACYLLLLANLVYMAIRYFNYGTETNVGFYTPVNFTSPNLSLCFDLNTILTRHERTIFHEVFPQYKGFKDARIFEMVPSTRQVLTKCALRDEHLGRMKYFTPSSGCSDIFNIERYRMQGLMCYLFQVKQQHSFSFDSLAFSPNEPRMLYKLAIDAPLNTGHAIVPLVHFEELADVDRTFLKELFPSRSKSEIFYLEYLLYEITRLPHPYTTKCGPDPLLRCYYKCLAHFYAKRGIVPSTGISRESPSNTTLMLTRLSLELFRKVSGFCRSSQCKSEACDQKLAITYISGPFKGRSDKLAFNLGTYRFPVNKIVHSPKLPFIEYVTQCLGLSGIWIGFSVVSCTFIKRRLDIKNLFAALMSLRVEVDEKLAKHSPEAGQVDQTQSPVDPQIGESKMPPKMSGKTVVSSLYKVTIVITFSFQAVQLCLLYSEYKTVLHHDHIMDPEFFFALPSTVICINLEDLFATRATEGTTEKNYESVLTGNKWTNLTLAQIFDQTMDGEMLYKCRVSNYEDFALNRGNFHLKSGQECLEEFSFHKYYSRFQMCYLFTPQLLPRTFSQWEFVSRGTNPARLYSLILNPKVRDFEKLELVVYFDGSNASYSSSESRAISPKSDGKRVVSLSYHTLVIHGLPRPYDTRCNPATNSGLTKCRQRCYIAGLRRAGISGLTPFANTVLETQTGLDDLRLISFSDMKNETINDLLTQLELECPKYCYAACHDNFTFTYSSHLFSRAVFDVELIINVDSQPRTLAKSVPRFSLYDFYYQIFCLLAFWLGFSFIGLDFIGKRREKQLSKNVRFMYTESISLLQSLGLVRRKHVISSRLARGLLTKRSICNLICVIGMCVHLVIPFTDYLSYPTILLTTTSKEEPAPYKLMLCSHAKELYEGGMIFRTERTNGIGNILGESLTNTLEGVKSPRVEYFCGYWGLSQHMNTTNKMNNPTDRIFFESSNSSLCQEMLELKTFVRQEDICFQFSLRRSIQWTRTQMLGSLNEGKTVFTVSVDSSLISSRFSVLAHEGCDPFYSTIWSSVLRKQSSDSRYIVSYTVYIAIPLRRPYSDKGFSPAHIAPCLKECGNGTLCKCSPHTSADADEKMHFSVSWIGEAQPFTGPKKGFTRFDLRRTDDPVIEMRFLSSISIYDLIINVGSIISIWFGLSVINLPGLVTESSVEQMYSEAQDNLKRAKSILQRVPVRNRPKIPVVAD